MRKIDKRIVELLNKTPKTKLREIVGRIESIDSKKLEKMSKEKCIPKLNHLSYSQLQKEINV